ncbi:TetR/AcrR family transcriptional regulator [Pseudomonas leptonychotis]|jgi:AcrR family transcriptional regulator|uniref:TetR/AcrR family transcriptional regulator n=1 Tax=Pseudomonas leptonychotis TaxID=2448482 RepID=A0A4T2A0F4_9PSED|nr:TetR/AcrR family transcriptional regulator [Pseudomonas leptonychotis]TIH10445.1 TetR/AcrR family transcriptional regulator [Pseudomonas leptonychotis]
MNSISSPTQARSKKALERFLNVAAELLADNRFEDTGISQIAQLAESSVGTFYRLLGDKDVLLYAVHERFVEQGRSAIDALVADLSHSDLPVAKQIEGFIQGMIDLFAGHEGLLRALVRRSSADLQFRQRFHQLNAYIGQTFCRIVLTRQSEFGHPQPQQAADLSAHMLLASMNYLTMVGTLGETPREVIPGELSTLICNYLEVAKH